MIALLSDRSLVREAMLQIHLMKLFLLFIVIHVLLFGGEYIMKDMFKMILGVIVGIALWDGIKHIWNLLI